MATRRFFSNCLFGAIYLLIRMSDAVAVGAVRPIGGWFPFHLVVIGRRGRVIHFASVMPHRENRLAPFFFLGRYEGVAGRRAKTGISAKRPFLWRWDRPRLFLWLALALCVILFPVWAIAWMSYLVYHPTRYLTKAVLKRQKGG